MFSEQALIDMGLQQNVDWVYTLNSKGRMEPVVSNTGFQKVLDHASFGVGMSPNDAQDLKAELQEIWAASLDDLGIVPILTSEEMAAGLDPSDVCFHRSNGELLRAWSYAGTHKMISHAEKTGKCSPDKAASIRRGVDLAKNGGR